VQKTLHVLVVDDSEDDAVLIAREFRRGGFDVVSERVDTALAMKSALARLPWDVVISDHAMPHFCALKALQVLKDSGLDLPFIIVSGAIGEDLAVEAMRSGAHDYVMKANLARLLPAVEREMREAEIRQEQRRAEEQLRHAERLAALGTFAAGIAHELNNPLAAILVTARQGLQRVQDPREIETILREILEDGERCTHIVAGVLKFARKPPSDSPPMLSLPDILLSACKQAERYAEQRRIKIELQELDGLPTLRASAFDLESVFVNLLINAVQASRPGQAVSVNVATLNGSMRISVQDHGRGMSAETCAHAFDPFFTTRANEGGTGLGLSMAHGIITGQGGNIQIESRPGHGTTVQVTLPCSAPECDGGI
jgi:signal transduction histidine kinase